MVKIMFEKYNTQYAKRFYKGQKAKFQEEIQKDFAQLGYNSLVDVRKVKFSKVRNVMIGNFKTAKNIIVVPYDTPSHVFWPNYKYYPQEGNYFMKKNFFPTYGPMLLSYVLLLFLVYVVPKWFPVQMQMVIFTLSVIYLSIVLTLIIKGFPNAKNAVRNTTSIALAYDLANSLSSDKQKECAFVFMDHSMVKSYGPQALEAFMGERQRKTNKIVLYCLGRGNEMSIGYAKGHRKQANDMIKKYKGTLNSNTRLMDGSDCLNNPMEFLQNAMMISSGDKEDTHLCVKNTACKKDNEYNQALYDDVKQMLINYLD